MPSLRTPRCRNRPLGVAPHPAGPRPGGPRASRIAVVVIGAVGEGMASMAGLPGRRACVRVGPPLSCNGPSTGSVLGRSVGSVRLQVPSQSRLWPNEAKTEANSAEQSAPGFATMVFLTQTMAASEQAAVIAPQRSSVLEASLAETVLLVSSSPSPQQGENIGNPRVMPAPREALLPDTVLFVMTSLPEPGPEKQNTVPGSLPPIDSPLWTIPPPKAIALLLLTVLCRSLNVPLSLNIPPPKSPWFPETVLRSKVTLPPKFRMPPPPR